MSLASPTAAPPTSDVAASQNGIFMTDDGRAFFSTADALVPRDANGIVDIYEYVEGRAQLISTGTGNDAGEAIRPIGLVGVSADGTNAFFSTYQTLVGQDENGPFYKLYVARTNGGFPFNKPPAPCAAADECHGPGAAPPAMPQVGSGAIVGGGNATVVRKKRKRARSATHRAPTRCQEAPRQGKGSGEGRKVEEMRSAACRQTGSWGARHVRCGLPSPRRLGAERAEAKSTVFTFTNTPSGTQAGSHPNVLTSTELGNRFNQGPMPACECNDPKDVTIHAPAGLVANPHVVSECTTAELSTFSCPPDAQAGFVVLRFFSWGVIPLYRTVPQEGQAALFVFLPPIGIAIPQYIAINARTGGDYGIDFTVTGPHPHPAAELLRQRLLGGAGGRGSRRRPLRPGGSSFSTATPTRSSRCLST